MERFVWDQFPSPARITVTILLLALAVVIAAVGGGAWVAVAILAAAIIFHTEFRLTIDPEAKTYERRTLVKPFGTPKTGSLDDIEHILLALSPTESGSLYAASIVFKAPKYSSPVSFPMCRGNMDDVLDEVARLVKATSLVVSESEELMASRKGYDSLIELLRKNR